MVDGYKKLKHYFYGTTTFMEEFSKIIIKNKYKAKKNKEKFITFINRCFVTLKTEFFETDMYF